MEILTKKEIDNIILWETFLNDRISKSICATLVSYRTKLLKTINEKYINKSCFCASRDRITFHKEFYLWYNKNKSLFGIC